MDLRNPSKSKPAIQGNSFSDEKKISEIGPYTLKHLSRFKLSNMAVNKIQARLHQDPILHAQTRGLSVSQFHVFAAPVVPELLKLNYNLLENATQAYAG